MAAANADPLAMRDAPHAIGGPGLRAACAAGTACALMAGGCAALSTQAGLTEAASAWWMSAMALAVMMGAPWLIARSSGAYRTLKTAATLIGSLGAMRAMPGYLRGFEHGTIAAVSMVVTGGALLLYWWRSSRSVLHSLHHVEASAQTTRVENGGTLQPALLALLAGVSSGSLARFQLFTSCGASGAQPLWQIALLFAGVCTLACVADRSNGSSNRMLIALYVARAALTGVLATADNPTLAPLAARLFLLLDCLTIPALANLRGNSASTLQTTCPGIAHHIGMVAGAALSTSPYFFGGGFVVLFALSAAANLICAASLLTGQLAHRTPRLHANRYHPEAHASPHASH